MHVRIAVPSVIIASLFCIIVYIIIYIPYFLGGKKVAVKIQKIEPEFIEDVKEEYRILRDLSDHSNLPDFYGTYLKKGNNSSERDQIWFVMQVGFIGKYTEL